MAIRLLCAAVLAGMAWPAYALTLAEPANVGDARLIPAECWFEIPAHRQAECAWFEPGGAALGKTVRLPVVRIPGEPAASPVLHVPGGPGYPAGLDDAGMAHWWGWQDSARWPHDLLLFDPRGTGLSTPSIDCPEIREFDRAVLDQPLTGEQELARLADNAAECHRRLGGDEALSAFTSAAQVHDIAALMSVLGSEQWNLWGVSYGSRIALHVAREAPERIRSLLLDSVYPPHINGLLARPAQFQRALEQVVAACEARTACAQSFPEVEAAIQSLLERLAESPIKLDFMRSLGAEPTTLAVTDFRLLWMLFFDSYLSAYDARGAQAVSQAVDGKLDALEPLAQGYVATLLDPSFSYPVYYSTACAEDWPRASEAAYERALAAHPRVAPYLRGEWQHAACASWPVAPLPARYHRPVKSDIPSLLLHGRRDSATLPEWASQTADYLGAGQAVFFKGASHATTFGNHCAMAVAQAFLENPANWQPPACLDKQRARARAPE